MEKAYIIATILSMKKAIIFLHGDLSDVSRMSEYVDKEDFIICADGGVEYALKAGYVPDIVIGDLDSISKESESKLKGQKVEFVKHPKDKDESDGELVISYAVDQGFKKIIIFGLLGRRIDHIVSNMFLPAVFQREYVDIRFVEGNQEIFIISKPVEIKGKVGDRLSLIPILGDVEGVSTEGLEFPLKNETLKFGLSRGISNVFTQNAASIKLSKGSLLAVHERS